MTVRVNLGARPHRAAALGLALALLATAFPPQARVASGAPGDSLASEPPRPFVDGGFDDKPHLTGLFGTLALGGYLEGSAGWARADGATDELGAELTRWNLLVSTSLHGRVTIFSELEVEEGGEEITLELAQVDVRFASAFTLRGGILLLPLGRFNLAHDAPRNEIVSRPAVAQDLLGVALAQPGLGAIGRFELARGARFTYEAYAVNGYHDGLISDSFGGTRLVAGRRNFEDANASPAVVGRLELSPNRRTALGLSGYHGAYNVYRLGGLAVDARRDVTVGVLDLELPLGSLVWSGEGALVNVEVPTTLEGLFASRQAGAYVMAAWAFGAAWVEAMPGSWFTVAARLDAVDFDRDLAGDSMRALSLGLNFRPVPETVLKLGYERGETRDRFNNLGTFARVQLGLASYF